MKIRSLIILVLISFAVCCASALAQGCATSYINKQVQCHVGSCHEIVTAGICGQEIGQGWIIIDDFVPCCGQNVPTCSTGQVVCYNSMLRSPEVQERLAAASTRRDLLVATCGDDYVRYRSGAPQSRQLPTTSANRGSGSDRPFE
jgi:hypothetical protein